MSIWLTGNKSGFPQKLKSASYLIALGMLNLFFKEREKEKSGRIHDWAVAFLTSALTFILIRMVQCNFKTADPGKIIPTPERCQTSDHGCLINAASSYCRASAFSCALSRRHTIQWSGHGSWHGICGQNHEWVLPAGDGTVRVGGDAASHHAACCSHSCKGNLLALCWFCGHKERRA